MSQGIYPCGAALGTAAWPAGAAEAICYGTRRGIKLVDTDLVQRPPAAAAPRLHHDPSC